MRRLSLLFVLLAACGTPATAPDATVGVRGASLESSLAVHVVRESDLSPIVGASVDVGGASMLTDANGDATLFVLMAPTTLHVTAPGYVAERWMGVDRDHVTVGLTPPIPARRLTGTITAGTSDTAVVAATAFGMLRTTSPSASVGACPSGGCEVSLTVETLDDAIDVLLVDSTTVRLAPHVAIDGTHFAIDASAATSLHLVTLDATIPNGAGLESVVGVPGVAGDGRVSLITSPASTTSFVAPALEGPLAADRLWYIARGQNADATGDSLIFDRDVQGTTARLPSAFLAIPSVTMGADVAIVVDPEATFYVLESSNDTEAERILVLHPGRGQLTLPLTLPGATRRVLRAVATTGTESDLGEAEALADRIATITL